MKEHFLQKGRLVRAAICVLLVLTFTASASAQDGDAKLPSWDDGPEYWQLVEEWSCYESAGSRKNVLVKLTREVHKTRPNMLRGIISVAGSHQVALFRVEGFNRKWDFPFLPPGVKPKFKFVINPDGTGLYYDFSNVEEGEITTPQQTYWCEERS